MIRVRVRARAQAGFMRCGLRWPSQWTETDVEESVAERLIGERMLDVHLVETADPKVPDTRDVQAPPPLPEPTPSASGDTASRLAQSAEAERQARVPDFDDDDLLRSPVQTQRRRGR